MLMIDLTIKKEDRQHKKEPHMDKFVKALKEETTTATRRHSHTAKNNNYSSPYHGPDLVP